MQHQPGHSGPDSRSAEDVVDPTRRRVLGLAAGGGAIGLLAACGGGGDTASPGSTGSTVSSGDGDSPGESSAPAESAAGTALVATAKVPVGGGVVLDKEKIVVTQPESGTFKAFTAICTHQSCTVAGVKNGVISCPCHGSGYNAADGSVKNGPATRPLREIPVTVEGDEVVTA